MMIKNVPRIEDIELKVLEIGEIFLQYLFIKLI